MSPLPHTGELLYSCIQHMDDLIARLEELPLSGSDLTEMSNKLGVVNTRFVQYADLRDESLDTLFAGACCVYILFEIVDKSGMAQKIGHWAVLIKSGVPTSPRLVYYDPYGLTVSEDLKLSGAGRLGPGGTTGESPWLERILRGHKVDVNTHRHQRFRDETNTCGRHTVVRSLFHFMSNRQYDDLVIKGVKMHVDTADTFVSLLTGFLADTDDVIQTFFKARVTS